MRHPGRIVVLGTGTGVGKTEVTVRLAQALGERKVMVRALKPVESGFERAEESDAARVAAGAGHPVVLPCFHFRAPISPHLAARKEGRRVRIADVERWVLQHEVEADVVLIEGAGGAFSPWSFEDSACALLRDAEWILVASNRLGVLHDALAVLHALREERAPLAIVLNELELDGTQDDNLRELAALTGLPVFRFARSPAGTEGVLALAAHVTKWLQHVHVLSEPPHLESG